MHIPVLLSEVLALPRPAAGRALRRRDGRRRRPCPGAAAGQRTGRPRARHRPRPGDARRPAPALTPSAIDARRLQARPTAASPPLADILAAHDFAPVDGVLFDLGAQLLPSRRQRARLLLPARRAARHALRPERRRAETAADILASRSAEELTEHLSHLRRGALRVAHRAHSRRPPAHRTADTRPATCSPPSSSRCRRPCAGARRATRRASFRRCASPPTTELDAVADALPQAARRARTRRPPGRHRLPLARGPLVKHFFRDAQRAGRSAHPHQEPILPAARPRSPPTRAPPAPSCARRREGVGGFAPTCEISLGARATRPRSTTPALCLRAGGPRSPGLVAIVSQGRYRDTACRVRAGRRSRPPTRPPPRARWLARARAASPSGARSGCGSRARSPCR